MISNEEIMLESLNEQLHSSNIDEYMSIMSKVPEHMIESLSIKQYETMLNDLHKFELTLSKLDKAVENRAEHEDFLKQVNNLKEKVSSFLKKASSNEYKNAVRVANGEIPDLTSTDDSQDKKKDEEKANEL